MGQGKPPRCHQLTEMGTQTHMIMDWLRWQWTSGGHLVQLPSSSRAISFFPSKTVVPTLRKDLETYTGK